MAMSRGSIGILFLRLTTKRIHRYLIYTVFVFSVVFGLLLILLFLLQCRPISYYWDRNQDGSCINKTVIVNMMYPYSAQALLCDSIFAILPMFIIQSLRVDRNTKMAIHILLGLGCVLVFAASRFEQLN